MLDTPMMVAIQMHSAEALDIILRNVDDVRQLNTQEGVTPLMFSAHHAFPGGPTCRQEFIKVCVESNYWFLISARSKIV